MQINIFHNTFFIDTNPPSASSSTSSNDANMPSQNPDLKLECLDKVKVDVENKPPSSNDTSQLTTEKLNEFNIRHDLTQENATPLTISVGGPNGTHLGPTSSSSSSTKLRKYVYYCCNIRLTNILKCFKVH